MRRSALRLCSRIVPWVEMLGESTYGRAAGAAVACALSHAAAGQPQMARGLHHKPAWMPSEAVDFGHKGIDPSRGFASLPDHVPLTMPALSPTMSQGNLSSWKKREGDAIAAGDILAEVETDKATIEWESQDEGFIAKILVPEGTKDIAVGTVVAVVVEDEKCIASFANFQPGAAPAEAASPTPAAAETPAAPASSYPPHTVVNMPALSPTMSQGTIVSWKKEEGAEVAPGDIFCEVETDKATIEWESQEEGVIAKILVQAGQKDVAVGSPVMVLVDDASQASAFASYQPSAAGSSPAPAAPATPAAAPPTPKPAPSPAAPATKKVAGDGSRVIASPYARKLASEAGVSLQGVAGSGPEGRIVAKDVEALIASGGAAGAAPAAAAVAGGDFTDIALTQVKRITAERLLQSKQQIPHYYLTIECQIDKLTKLRAALNSTLEVQGAGKLSVNDFVIKAAALALKKVPEVNSSWMGDFIRQYNNVDVSVAVMTPIGLQVPIVKDADKKGLSGLSSDVKRLVAKAKEGKLAPEEFMGGTFTISNLGMFGIKQFCAIINPPQSCILAVGAPHKKVVLTKQGSYEEVTTIACTLSCDHRVVDGAVGATWLQAFKTYMEDPVNMML